jgi:hypothetical protein
MRDQALGVIMACWDRRPQELASDNYRRAVSATFHFGVTIAKAKSRPRPRFMA